MTLMINNFIQINYFQFQITIAYNILSSQNRKYLQMDAILQQKKKGQAQFRIQINQLLADSLFTKQQEQLTPDVLQQIFQSSLKQSLFQNGKISLDKLTQTLYSTTQHFNPKQFAKIFNNKKFLRPQDLHLVLKAYDLTSFDLEQQIMKNFFDDNKFSIKKLDKVMSELGYNEFNKKDKQIMVECFDYNRDGSITDKDLNTMIKVVKGARQQKKKKRQSRKQSTLKTTVI